MKIQTFHIIIDKRPLTFWDWELEIKNIEFLEGIDPEYFFYIAEQNILELENENKHRAAITIRLAYSHALETLFALLGAVVQAPQCPLGWMLNYKNFELLNVTKDINVGAEVITRFKDQNISWKYLSKAIHHNLSEENRNKAKIVEGYGVLWSRLASDFTDPHFSYEYNGIKHGLRVSPGGFTMIVCPEISPGVPDSPDKAINLGGSDFGSSYFANECIGDAPKHNIRPRRHARNWDPIHLANRLPLIAMSINNVISWLCIIGGKDPIKCKFNNPANLEAFEEPWGDNVSLNHSSFDLILSDKDIVSTPKKAIVENYLKI